MRDYIIREANENDCKELSHIKHTVWETTYRGIYSDEKIDNYNYEEQANKFRKLINNTNIKLYVVEYNKKIIGYMSCGKPIRQYKNYEQEIGLLYILKEFQGKGLGKKLFNIAYNDIKLKGVTEFYIACNKYNINAQRFYQKMGGIISSIDEDHIDKSYPQIYFIYKIKENLND